MVKTPPREQTWNFPWTHGNQETETKVSVLGVGTECVIILLRFDDFAPAHTHLPRIWRCSPIGRISPLSYMSLQTLPLAVSTPLRQIGYSFTSFSSRNF